MSIPRFNFYTYVDKIKALITAEFPSLETVSFQPSTDGSETSYSDVAVAAFLMSFGDPEIAAGFPMRAVDAPVDPPDDNDADDNKLLSSKSGYFMDVRIHLEGELLLPRFKTTGQNARNLNMSIAVFQAASNIASLIYSKAGDDAGATTSWHCGPARIEGISYQPHNDYHIARVLWSHQAFVGKESGDTDNLVSTYLKIAAADPNVTLQFEFESDGTLSDPQRTPREKSLEELKIKTD